jgi:hypothetical protein
LDHAQKQGSACPWKLPGSRTAITRKLGPSKLSGRRSGLDPSPQSEPAESSHSSPPAGGLPPPQELAAGLERDQVSVRISISAPFRVRTVRTECLDWTLVLGRRHLERVLRTYTAHYNEARPHRGLDLKTPEPRQDPLPRPVLRGQVRRHDLLGGHIHEYELVA